jgi:sec-independent protein translocase protein TatA
MQNNILLFFNIGGAELFFIVLVVIMFFGSKKIPELARSLGKGMKELKNATNDIQQEIKDSTKDISKLKDTVNVEKQVKDLMTESKQEVVKEKEEPPQPSQPNTVSRTSPYSKPNPSPTKES